MPPAEVVVTGIGMVTPLGTTREETVQAWHDGKCAIRRPLAELSGTALADLAVAVVPELDPGERLGSRRMLKYMSQAAVLGCVAAREAVQQARVRERFDPERVGLFAATGLAAVEIDQAIPLIRQSVNNQGHFSTELLGARGLAVIDPLLSFKTLANMPACLISIQEKIKGPSYIFTPWEGQSATALREGWQAVARGEVVCAVVGAADTPAHPATILHLCQNGWIGPEEYPANASAYLVLETAQTAHRDQQRVYASIESLSTTYCDGGVEDLVAERLGRSFAAAPALALSLACALGWPQVAMQGVDGRRMLCRLKEAA